MGSRGSEPWYIYLLECCDGSIYTGITADLQRRYGEHSRGEGARYTRSFPPTRMLAAWRCADRSQASRAEHRLRSLSSSDKRRVACTGDISQAISATAERVTAEELPR